MAEATPSHSIKQIKRLWGSVWHTNIPVWLLHIKSRNSSSILWSQTHTTHSFELAITLENTTGLLGEGGMSFSRSTLWPIWEQILTTEINVNYAINFYIAQPRGKKKKKKEKM